MDEHIVLLRHCPDAFMLTLQETVDSAFFSYCLLFVRQRGIEQKYYTEGKAMEIHFRKCQRCEEFGLNNTKLPLRYTRRESTLDFEDFRCDRCLFEMVDQCLMSNK